MEVYGQRYFAKLLSAEFGEKFVCTSSDVCGETVEFLWFKFEDHLWKPANAPQSRFRMHLRTVLQSERSEIILHKDESNSVIQF